MIGTRRAEADGQLSTPGAGQLVGVHPDPHAEASRGAEDPLGRPEREEPSVAEDVAELRRAGRGHRGEHLLDDQGGVLLR